MKRYKFVAGWFGFDCGVFTTPVDYVAGQSGGLSIEIDPVLPRENGIFVKDAIIS